MEKIPDDLVDLVTTDVVAHVTMVEADGSLVTHVLWIDYDGEHLMLWSRSTNYKNRGLRARPNVAVSVVDRKDPWRRLSISGRVTEFRDDVGQSFMNSLSERYVHEPYPRSNPGEIIVITPDRVRAFRGRFSAPVEVATA